MIEVVVIWILMGFLALYLGQRIEGFFRPVFGGEGQANIWLRFWMGMATLSFLLGLISFFVVLSPWVKAVLWVFWGSTLFFDRKQWQILFQEVFQRLKSFHPISWVLVFLCSGIALLKASGPPEIFDEGAYHLPLIRMWENQGLVLGMANLNGHYGLNSTWHILSAFSNLSFLPFWKTEMALNGLISVVLAFYAGSRLRLVLQGTGTVSSWISLLLPFFVFRNLLSSPSTDIPAIICTWFVFTLWLEVIEKEGSPWEIWPVFAVLPFWIVILKTSSAALLLVPAGAILFAAEENSIKKIRWLIGIGLALLVPWVLQNWLLTGYAVFPIKITALGHPVWQVPVSSIEKKFFLEQFGAFAPPKTFSISWVKSWFQAHNSDSKVIILLSFLSLTASFFTITFSPAYRGRIHMFLFFSVLACLMSWFLTITEPRYGFGSLVFSALFPVGIFLVRISGKYRSFRWLGLIILILQGFNASKTWKEFNPTIDQIFSSEPYPNVKFRPIQTQNFKGVVPVAYLTKVPAGKPPFCWDCPFPCIPLEGSIDSSHIFRFEGVFYSGFGYK